MGKLAIVHCRIKEGGAYNFLLKKIDEFNNKEKKIFTLFAEKKYVNLNNDKIEIITVLPRWILKIFDYFMKNKIFLFSSLFDYRNLIVIYPICMKILSKKIKSYNPEQIYISSFAIAKNIYCCKNNFKGKRPNTTLYLHSPMQYIWSHYEDYKSVLKRWQVFIFGLIVNRLRKRDKKYTKYDKTIANSNYTKNLAKEIYNIDCVVKYPEIDKLFYSQKISGSPKNYYVFVGRVSKLIRHIDIIIELFNKLKKNLIVIGDGPDMVQMKKIGGDSIIFTGWIDDVKARIEIIKNSKGLINLTKESFGLNTKEALVLGIPVFGLNAGATRELVNSSNGVLNDNLNINHLIKNFEKFEKL